MEGLASSCCFVAPRECSSAAKASLVGARKVAVMYGECTSSATHTDKVVRKAQGESQAPQLQHSAQVCSCHPYACFDEEYASCFKISLAL